MISEKRVIEKYNCDLSFLCSEYQYYFDNTRINPSIDKKERREAREELAKYLYSLNRIAEILEVPRIGLNEIIETFRRDSTELIREKYTIKA